MLAVALAASFAHAMPVEGEIARVKVTAVYEHGCFVRGAAGWDGHLHVTDIAWERVYDTNKYCKVGKSLDVKVVRVGNERVAVSRKMLVPDPWAGAAKKYPVGKRVKAKVVVAVEYGLWVELEPGVEALVHVSELPADPKKIPREGKRVGVVIIDIDEAAVRAAASFVGVKRSRGATPSRAVALDALRDDLLPNLRASLSVLGVMAQAGKIVEDERALAAWTAALVVAHVETICAASTGAPSDDDCGRARDAAKVARDALAQPTAPSLDEARDAVSTLTTLTAGW